MIAVAQLPAPRPVLLAAALHHYEHDGWFPVPGAAGKKPALREYGSWASLAKRGNRPDWPEIERTFVGDRVVGIGHLIVAGFCAVDVDGEPGEAVLRVGPAPETPEVSTYRGRHMYFRGARNLPSFAKLGEKIQLLGPGHYAELPPTNGKVWARHLTGELPRLPRHLRALVGQERTTTATAKTAAITDTEAELAAWREVLGELGGSGPWRGRCPIHEDGRTSFSVFRGQSDGRLIGRCHAGCGAWTLRRLRRRLGNRLVGQYRAAQDAITSLGDEIDRPMRDALRWLIAQAEDHNLSLADPQGIGASYRQLAAATGLEQVGDDRRLSNRGRSVMRLLEALRALGVAVTVGQQWTPDGGKGAPTRLRLPAAWLAASGSIRGGVTLGDAEQ